MKTVKQRLQNSFWSVTTTLIVVIVWSFVAFFQNEDHLLLHETEGFLASYIEGAIGGTFHWFVFVQLIVLLSTVFLIRYMEETNNLFRKKSIFTLVFPALIFLGSGSWFQISPVPIYTLFFVVLLLMFFQSYRSANPDRTLFYLSLILSVFSLLDVDFLYLFPTVWVSMGYFKTFSIRTFFITVFGALIPYFYFLGFDFYAQDSLDFSIAHMIGSFGVQEVIWTTQSAIDMIYWAIVVLFTLVAIINFSIFSYKERLRVRESFMVLLWFWVSSFILLVFNCGKFAYIESLFLLVSSIFISHYFTVAKDAFALFTFYLFIVILFMFPIIRTVWNF